MRFVVSVVSALILSGTVLCAVPSASVAAATTTSYVTMSSESGDSVGQGQDWFWGSGDVITASRSTEGLVTVNVSGGSESTWFSFTFTPRTGAALDVGEYEYGLDVGGDGRGCLSPSGKFRVLDIAPDLSHIWITFEQHCSISFVSKAPVDPALFGEIKLGMPKASTGIDVRAESVTWPPEYLGIESKTFPVPVVNTGTETVDVSSAVLSGDTSAFSVMGSTCSHALAPGEACDLYLGFDPPAVGTHRASIDFVAGGRSHRVYLEGDGIGGTTSWTMSSEPGELVGDGQSFAFDPANTRLEVLGDWTRVHFYLRSLQDNGVLWDAHFATVGDHAFRAGDTFQAVTYPGSPDAAGMRVNGNQNYCSTADGSFTVDDYAVDGGLVVGAAITFTQRCEGEAAALTGTISYRAGADLSSAPTTLTTAATPSLVTYPNASTIHGRLFSSERGAPLAAEPVLIYGRAFGTNDWHYLARITTDQLGNYAWARRPVSISYYRVLYFGRSGHDPVRSPGVRVRLRARVQVAVNDASIAAGHWLRLRMTVGPVQPGRYVVVQRYRGGAWRTFARSRLDAHSVARLQLRLTRPGRYTLRVLKPADQVTIASTSRTVRIVVK